MNSCHGTLGHSVNNAMITRVKPVIFPLISDVMDKDVFVGLSTVSSYLEIGVSDGFSLECRLREHFNMHKIVLCDTWKATDGGTNRGNHKHIEKILTEWNYPLERVVFLDGRSQDTLPEYFDQYPDELFDLVFVDGDHTGHGLWVDLQNVFDHSRIIAVHDIRNVAHGYLRDVLYAFYETVREQCVLLDDGADLGIMIKKYLFQW